jgi:hypothetical protein
MATNEEILLEEQAAAANPQLEAVNTERAEALQAVENVYGGQAEQAGQLYGHMQTATKEWTDKQAQLQQEQTDFTIEQLQQQQDQAKKSYEQEQSAAYTDYQKQTAQHGVNAEQMASMGMSGTGYSESSKVQMYTAYQNRVATAKASYDQAVLNFQNGMKEARLQNSSALAQIQFQGLQTQLTLAMEGLQYENDLLAQELQQKLNVKNMYHSQYMDVWSMLEQQKAQEESIRQYNERFAYQQAQDAQAQQNWQAQFDYGKTKDAQAQANWQTELERLQSLDKQKQENWEKSFAEEQRQFNAKNKIEYATDDDMFAMLGQMYPNGVVTDKETWDMMVAVFGEDALKKKGLKYQTVGSTGGSANGNTVQPPKKTPGVTNTLR